MPTTTATYSAYSSQINGDKESSYMIKVQIENPLLAMGTIVMILPKSNINYMNHGTTFGKEFITNGYEKSPKQYTVEVTYGSVGSSSETPIPLDLSDPEYPSFDYSYTD